MNDRTDDRKVAFYDGHVRTALDPSVEDALLTASERAEIVAADDAEIAGTDAADSVDVDVAVPDIGVDDDTPDRTLEDLEGIEDPEGLELENAAPVDAERRPDIGAEAEPEFDVESEIEAACFRGSPAGLGDAIPDGLGSTTAVTDIAAVTGGRGEDVGWAYRGGNGADYFQPSPTSNRAAAVGVAMEVTAWHGGADGQSGVRNLQSGDIRAGDTVHAMNGPSTWLDLTKLGYTPHQTMTLGEGSQATGKILAVTESDVIQNAGRGVVYVHPRDAFYDAVPQPGSQVKITNENGRLQTFTELERPQEVERGQDRGPRSV